MEPPFLYLISQDSHESLYSNSKVLFDNTIELIIQNIISKNYPASGLTKGWKSSLTRYLGFVTLMVAVRDSVGSTSAVKLIAPAALSTLIPAALAALIDASA